MKTDKNKMKITSEQLLKMARAANRDEELKSGGRINHHKAHKLATDYNRQKSKRINLNED